MNILEIFKIYKNKIILDAKSVIRLILSIGLYYSGLISLFKYINRKNSKTKGIKILAYHDITDRSYLNLQVPERIFKRHIEYLIKNNYKIISLKEAVNLLKKNDPITEDTIVITFDDGYKSIYTTVFPIIKQYGIPITVFLTTEAIEGKPLFCDALAYALENTTKKKLDLTYWNMKEYLIKSSLLKEKALYEINEHAKSLNTEDKNKLLKFIFEKLDVDLNAQELRNKMLSWNEIIEMSKDTVSFGAHTVSHPVLSRIPIDEARQEILRSKNIIQEKLIKEIKTFAYPYGSYKDINEGVKKIVKNTGFSCACTLQNGLIRSGDDPYLLNRICVTNQIKLRFLWFFSKAIFATEISGIWDVLLFKKKYTD